MGGAHQFLEAAHAWMAAQRVFGREVFVTAANAAATKLYERHGYRVVDLRMMAPRPR